MRKASWTIPIVGLAMGEAEQNSEPNRRAEVPLGWQKWRLRSSANKHAGNPEEEKDA
jgi:hypothetical protein